MGGIVLLIGGYGQLGTAIRRRWTGAQIVAPPRDELDIENGESVRRAFERYRPALVVNCAAFHDVDRCEREPERAFAVNAYAVRALTHRCAEFDAAFVTISTDYVFDGRAARPYTESDAEHPLSAYAASKLAGEAAARMGGRVYVVRTCGVYGHAEHRDKPSFIDRVVARAAAGERVTISPEIVASPTFAGHLADALRSLAETGNYGLYHAVNEGPVSWFDFAAEAMRQAGVSAKPVPGSAPVRSGAAARPQYSALDCTKLARLGIRLRIWQEGIRDYLAERAVPAGGLFLDAEVSRSSAP